MDIEIKDRNKLKEIFYKLYDRLEDLLFSIIMKLPERFISKSVADRLNRYMTKRLNQLKQVTVKQAWRKMYLQDAINDISTRQQDKEKAPAKD